MIAVALLAVAAFLSAVLAERTVEIRRTRANARVFAAYPYIRPVTGAARIVAVCDSCQMALGEHRPTCMHLSGHEAATVEDARRVA